MGYSKLIQKRKEQAECAVDIEASRHDVLPKSDVPIFAVFYATIVSGITGLLGTLFFAHKWFKCLNYVYGRGLFKVPVLTGVWAVLMCMVGCSVWIGSSWLLFFVWGARISFVVYFLSQLRKCRLYRLTTMRRFTILSAVLYTLWFLGIMFIWRCGCVELWCNADGLMFVIIVLFLFIIVEICLIQKMFNLAVYDMTEHSDFIDAKIANDWYRLRIAVVWGAVVLSVLLFVWDVVATILDVLNLDSGSYHGFNMDGKFHFWLFAEDYSPHAGWQLLLWCIAAVTVIFHYDSARKNVNAMINLFSRENLMRAWVAIRRFFSAMFPNVANQQGVEGVK